MVSAGFILAVAVVAIIAFMILSGVVITAENLAGAFVIVGFFVFIYIQKGG